MLTDEERHARSKRVRELERLERWKVILGVVAVIGLAAALIWRANTHPLPIASGAVAASCRTGYQNARSAAESLSVDVQRPLNDPEQDVPANISCGELRRSGELAR